MVHTQVCAANSYDAEGGARFGPDVRVVRPNLRTRNGDRGPRATVSACAVSVVG